MSGGAVVSGSKVVPYKITKRLNLRCSAVTISEQRNFSKLGGLNLLHPFIQ